MRLLHKCSCCVNVVSEWTLIMKWVSRLLHNTYKTETILTCWIVYVWMCVFPPSPPSSVTSSSFLSLFPAHSLPPQGSLLFGSCGFWSSGLSQLPYHPFSLVVLPPSCLRGEPELCHLAVSPYTNLTTPCWAIPFHGSSIQEKSTSSLRPLTPTENPPHPPPASVSFLHTSPQRMFLGDWSTGQRICLVFKSTDTHISCVSPMDTMLGWCRLIFMLLYVECQWVTFKVKRLTLISLLNKGWIHGQSHNCYQLNFKQLVRAPWWLNL